jgi:hypothetical protein
MRIEGPETRECPLEIQERLTRMFGRNQFGDPHIKIVWNQSQFIRLGWQWKDSFGCEHTGYRERYQGDGTPCWMVMRWKPAGFYGSPDTYYANTWMPSRTAAEDLNHRQGEAGFDSPDGFYVTAEYPYRGRYEIVVPLVRRSFFPGNKLPELRIEHLPLDHFMVDRLIPLILLAMEMTQEERAAAREAEEEAEQKRLAQLVEEKMAEALPAFYGPVSFNRQGCRTSLLDRKMQQIQKKWNELSRQGAPRFQPGMAQGYRPMVLWRN